MTWTTSEVCDKTGATKRQLIFWVDRGYLRPQRRTHGSTGPGNPFEWSDLDVAVINRAMRRQTWGMTVEASFRVVDPPPYRLEDQRLIVNATCPECGEHLRAIGSYAVLGQMVTWLACDTCGMSWSEYELDTVYAERERAAGDAGEPTVTVPKAEWDALVDALSVAEWLPPSRVASGHRRRIIDAARALVEAVQR